MNKVFLLEFIWFDGVETAKYGSPLAEAHIERVFKSRWNTVNELVIVAKDETAARAQVRDDYVYAESVNDPESFMNPEYFKCEELDLKVARIIAGDITCI